MKSTDYRYEDKFVCNQLAFIKVKSLIDSRLFLSCYPSRFVYSLYFDTPTLDYFADNLSGVKDRIKHRLRWYSSESGDMFGFQLESKLKNGRVGKKIIRPIQGIDLNTYVTDLKMLIKQSLLPTDDLFYTLDRLDMQLFCRYRREYYQNPYQIRCTFDTDLSYALPLSQRLCELDYSAISSSSIIEFKYSVDQRFHAVNILKDMPVPSTRCSKYSLGQAMIYGHSYL